MLARRPPALIEGYGLGKGTMLGILKDQGREDAGPGHSERPSPGSDRPLDKRLVSEAGGSSY
jgi:hypothetical protein